MELRLAAIMSLIFCFFSLTIISFSREVILFWQALMSDDTLLILASEKIRISESFTSVVSNSFGLQIINSYNTSLNIYSSVLSSLIYPCFFWIISMYTLSLTYYTKLLTNDTLTMPLLTLAVFTINFLSVLNSLIFFSHNGDI